jgi:hypothetical protein
VSSHDPVPGGSTLTVVAGRSGAECEPLLLLLHPALNNAMTHAPASSLAGLTTGA